MNTLRAACERRAVAGASASTAACHAGVATTASMAAITRCIVSACERATKTGALENRCGCDSAKSRGIPWTPRTVLSCERSISWSTLRQKHSRFNVSTEALGVQGLEHELEPADDGERR